MQKSIPYLFLVLILIQACSSDDGEFEQPVPVPSINESSSYNEVFTRNGNGWTGGDGTLSLRLQNGKTLWFFGDTFLDTVYMDRTRPTSAGLIKNTIVVENGNEFETLYQKTPNPSAFVSPSDNSQWYWPQAAIEQPDCIEVIYQKFERTDPNSAFGFQSIGVDVVQLDKVDYSIKSITPKIERIWYSMGSCILQEADFTYIYGIEKVDTRKFMHIARIPSGSLLQEWTYWDGQSWIPNHSDSKQMLEGVSDQYTVFFRNNKYYLLNQETGFGNKILLYDTTSPTGEWQNEQEIYRTPFLGSGTWSYNALAHPGISEPNELLISYNVNSLNFSDLFSNADLYRPYFVVYENF